jgi:DNA polymerase-1
MNKKLFLIDGHAMVYRAHYAFINRPLINSRGINTSAVAGFVRMVWDILKRYEPSHIGVCFDPDGPTFRHEQYEPYKANRDKQPEDISIAIPIIKELMDGFRIPVYEVPGFEADDVIGTLARQAERQGFEVYMVTPDKDYGQLVSDQIFMFKPGKQGEEEILGTKEIKEKWQITRIDQVIDMLGLQGDAVDNIPGVRGIGPKGAVRLLEQYGTLEGIYEHLDEIKGAVRNKLEEARSDAFTSRELATIRTDVPLTFDVDDLERSPMNKAKLADLFKELEFRTIATNILSESRQPGVQQSLFGEETPVVESKKEVAGSSYSIAQHDYTSTEKDYRLVDTPAAVQAMVEEFSGAVEFCFDTETSALDPSRASLVGMAFSNRSGSGYYIPVPPKKSAADELLSIVRPLLENEKILKIGQNIKYDILVMKWHGVEVKGPFFDTMIAHYLLEPDQRHKLDYLSETLLNYKMIPIEDLIGKRGKKQGSMRDIDPARVAVYAAEDADVTYQLKLLLGKKLVEAGLQSVFEEIEMPLVPVLASMEYEGVKVDAGMLREYSKELAKTLDRIEREIYDLAGVRFNIASPKQVGEVLFDRLKIPYRWRKTGSGQYSTSEEKLAELSVENEIVSRILEFRKLQKLKNTYVDTLPELIHPVTGRIHTSYNQARAATGRLSSEKPNLQNIPIRDEAGREIRKAFKPADGEHILMAADYSQIELRLIAEMSGERAMLEAFESGQDIHRATAARVYGVPLDQVSPAQRRNAKTVNFSIIYGAGATNLSQQLNIRREEAKTLIGNYFQQYQGLKQYMDSTLEFARENGYVQTMLGRKRILRDINSRNGMMRSNAERMAINTPIQGTAADMIKMAMIGIQRSLVDGNFRSRMILQVHDELVFDVYKPELEKLIIMVKDRMRNAIKGLKVPILVDAGTGENWLEAH